MVSKTHIRRNCLFFSRNFSAKAVLYLKHTVIPYVTGTQKTARAPASTSPQQSFIRLLDRVHSSTKNGVNFTERDTHTTNSKKEAETSDAARAVHCMVQTIRESQTGQEVWIHLNTLAQPDNTRAQRSQYPQNSRRTIKVLTRCSQSSCSCKNIA